MELQLVVLREKWFFLNELPIQKISLCRSKIQAILRPVFCIVENVRTLEVERGAIRCCAAIMER